MFKTILMLIFCVEELENETQRYSFSHKWMPIVYIGCFKVFMKGIAKCLIMAIRHINRTIAGYPLREKSSVCVTVCDVFEI